MCVQKFPVLPLLLLPRLNEIGIFNGDFFPLSLSPVGKPGFCVRALDTDVERILFECVCFCPATKKKRETLDVCCMTTNACCNRVVWHSDIHDRRQDISSSPFALSARHLHHSPSSLPTIPQTSVDAPPPIYAPSMINLPTRIGREIRYYLVITEIVRSKSNSCPKEVNLGSNFWAAAGMNHRKICL